MGWPTLVLLVSLQPAAPNDVVFVYEHAPCRFHFTKSEILDGLEYAVFDTSRFKRIERAVRRVNVPGLYLLSPKPERAFVSAVFSFVLYEKKGSYTCARDPVESTGNSAMRDTWIEFDSMIEGAQRTAWILGDRLGKRLDTIPISRECKEGLQRELRRAGVSHTYNQLEACASTPEEPAIVVQNMIKTGDAYFVPLAGSGIVTPFSTASDLTKKDFEAKEDETSGIPAVERISEASSGKWWVVSQGKVEKRVVPVSRDLIQPSGI